MTKKIKLKISSRLVKKKMRRTTTTIQKSCRFCTDAEYAQGLDYKNATFLRGFLTERGKILHSMISGNCAKHQRCLAHCVKKARVIALVPFAAQYN
jgi:small subunit ribosomal protein S18